MFFWLLFTAFAIVILFVVAFVLFVIELTKRARMVMKAKSGKRVYDPELYKTMEWKALRYYVLAKNNFKCAWCGGKAETAHHVSYRHGVLCPPTDLVPLCWPCHNQIHAIKEQAKWN